MNGKLYIQEGAAVQAASVAPAVLAAPTAPARRRAEIRLAAAVFTATVFVTAALSLVVSCDLFNPARYNDAVDAYNAVDNPGYSNYWRRLYYTGADLNAGGMDEQSLAVIDGTVYVFGQTYDDPDEGTGTTATSFGKVDLETLVSEELTMFSLSDLNLSGYTVTVRNPVVHAGGDLFMFVDAASETDSSGHSLLFCYLTAEETWEKIDYEIGENTIALESGEILDCGERVFLFFMDTGSTRAPHLYEYENHEFTEIPFPAGNYHACLCSDDTLIVYDDFLEYIARFNNDTDVLESVSFTDTLEDSPASYAYTMFLSDSNRLYALRWDTLSADDADFSFDPLLIDYIDLDGSLVWTRETHSDQPRIGGTAVSADCFGDDIYLIPATSWNGIEDLPNAPAELFRINHDDLSLENLGALPRADEAGFQYKDDWIIEANGMLFLNIEVGLLTFSVPKPYLYDPAAADGEEWTPMGYVRNFLGTQWSHVPDNDYGWYNGKYYLGGVDGSPEAVPNCLFVYTPPTP